MENNNLQTILSTMIQHLGVIASGNQQILEKLDDVIIRLQQQVPVQDSVIQATIAQEPAPTIQIPVQQEQVDVQPTDVDSTVAELVANALVSNDSADDIISKISAELLADDVMSTEDTTITIPTEVAPQAVPQEPVKTREQRIEEITHGLQFDPALVGSVLQTANSGVTDPMIMAGTLGVSVETISAILGLSRDDLVKHITALASIQAL